jgi:hypothetical protein
MQLMEVYFPNKTLFRAFLKSVFVHNRTHVDNPNRQQFFVYMDYQVIEMTAITKL